MKYRKRRREGGKKVKKNKGTGRREGDRRYKKEV